MSAWVPEERPEEAVAGALALAARFGPFMSVIEFGTSLRRAERLLEPEGLLITSTEKTLGSGVEGRRYELAIALHVLEHCEDASAAARDLLCASWGYVLVEVPALEVELDEQGFDDINPGHLHHFSMRDLLGLFYGADVMAVEAVRSGPWPCNRALFRVGESSIEDKRRLADIIYRSVAERCVGDAYLGDGYSRRKLVESGAPDLPTYDTHKRPLPAEWRGRLILTPRYLPTRIEMAHQYQHLNLVDPWRT